MVTKKEFDKYYIPWQVGYMKDVDHSISYCFDKELKQDQLFPFLDAVYASL
jgi:hypothetical protein